MPQKILSSYGGQWKGVDVSTTPYDIPPVATPFVTNFVGRGGFLQTRGRFVQLLGAPPDNQAIAIIFDFKDINGKYHTNAITLQNWYEIHGPAYSYSQVGAVNAANLSDYCIFAQAGYVTSTTTQGIWSWDGMSAITEVTGGKYGAAYIFELAGSICIANTVETVAPFNFPYRIRWCVAGQPTQWDPNTYRGAGFIDVLDTADDITGVMSMGTIAYILRTNGLSQMIPTGVGNNAFSISHMWNSDNGTGELYPELAASFGSIGFITSKEDIYALTVSSLNPIGGAAKYAIYADILQASDNAPMVGFITHKQVYSKLYPVYNIMIPVTYTPGTVTWTYSLDDKSWMRHFYSTAQPTGKPNFVYMPTA